MWKLIRVSVLLSIFFTISAEAYLQKVKSTSWEEPLQVTVYPIAADNSSRVRDYIQQLSDANFEDIERFMRREAGKYSQSLETPVEIHLGRLIEDTPPVLDDMDNPLENLWFSLKFRLWTEKNDKETGFGGIRLFVVFHDPGEMPVLPHSLAMQKGLMGIVHAYADSSMEGSNNFVIAHEMLHTVGATDKYDPYTNLPVYPSGYALPHKSQLYPQLKAEIMGGRIPLDESEASMPESLDSVVIGGQTAWEINWFK
ncbi:MAG: hypothetical protein ACWA5X_09450 [bacterium]